MRFTQFAVVDWTDGKGRGYTIFALGEDGRVYKSIPKFPGPNHMGWLPLAEEILPEDVKIVRFKKPKAESIADVPEEAPSPVAV